MLANTTTVATNVAKFLIDLPILIFIFVRSVITSLIRALSPKRRKNLTSSDRILVTGAASGLGQCVVWKLCQEFPEAQYILWDVNEKGLECTAKRCREEFCAKNVHCFVVDLTNREDIVEKAAQVRNQFGGITILWNNAGLSPYVKFLEGDGTQEEAVIRVNLLSYMFTIGEFLPEMVRRGEGQLVCTCSGLGFYRWSHLTSYVASKYGLRGFLEALKLEMRQHPGKPKIKFSTIFPSFVKTPMIQVANWEPRYKMKGFEPMEVEYVAHEIVEGILREKEEIMIPGSIQMLDWAFKLLPSHFWDRLDQHLYRNLTITNSNNNEKMDRRESVSFIKSDY